MDREGHLEEYTLLCDQTNEELNLHRIEDVALSKECSHIRERSIVAAEVLHREHQETNLQVYSPLTGVMSYSGWLY